MCGWAGAGADQWTNELMDQWMDQPTDQPTDWLTFL